MLLNMKRVEGLLRVRHGQVRTNIGDDIYLPRSRHGIA